MNRPSARRLFGAVLTLAVALALPHGANAQQEYTITGIVVDAATQTPISSAQVELRGTRFGTLTDQEGRFGLRATAEPGAHTIRVTRIGRRAVTQEVTLAAETTVNVGTLAMVESAVELDEVVVTGAGAPTERRQLGNTIASIPGPAVNEAPGATAIDQALQGRIAGAVISQNSGHPAGNVSIRLRGTSTILGGAEPLIVIDGVIVENNSAAMISLGANAGRGAAALTSRLHDIAPGDVERIEVLKGAAAAALYGSRANNGVIQIFTRRGQVGAPLITFRSENSMSSTDRHYDLATGGLATPGDVVFGPATDVGQQVDRFLYQGDIFRRAFGTQNELSISGGAENTSYYLSGNWSQHQGIVQGTGNERLNARAKLTQRLADWFEIAGTANYITSESQYTPEGEQTAGVLTTLIFTPTSWNPTFDDVTLRYPASPIIATNPFEVIDNWAATADVTRFVGSLQATATPIEDLTLTYLFGIDDSREANYYLQPVGSPGAFPGGQIQNPVRSIQRYNNDLTATHDFTLPNGWDLTTTAGFRHTFDRANELRSTAQGLNPGQTTIGAGGATPLTSQSISEVATVGGFLQERLGIGGRLFLTAGLNMEGASTFGPAERWQWFPRFGASYVVSEEAFWQQGGLADWIPTLRLRGSYGETGGQPPGAYIRFDNYLNTAHAGRPGFIPAGLAGNENLRPERQREWEGGFEAGFLEDRVGLEFTYYDQLTDDLVLSIPLPLSSGFTSQFQNIGEVSNRGVEIGLTTVNVNRPNFTWNSRLNFSSNRNRVEQLAAASDTIASAAGYPNFIIEGQPIGVFVGPYYPRDEQGNVILFPRGPNNEVLWQEPCPPGSEATCYPTRARDADGRILRAILGDPNPDFEASLSNEFSFGPNLQLSFLLDGRFGNDVANFSRRISEYFGAGAANESEARGDVAVRRNPAGAVAGGFYTLNLERHLLYEEFIEDGSFVKLREIALGYQVPQGWVRGFGVDRMSLRLAARNLYTWTNYTGIDPEINMFSANTVARGVDFATTPIPRTFVLGLTMNF
jgi:TonB-dependent starch-binding outer membrane protein SusC